jgi:membrane protein implicated in regulation of membrane protease activity
MNNFNSVEIFYAISAILGGVLFLIRTVLTVIGGDLDADSDVDFAIHDVNMDGVMDGDIGDHSVSHIGEANFQLFSLHGITGFFMIFGLIGLALSKAGVNDLLTALAGLVAGGITMVVVAAVYWYMRTLQSDGTMKIESTIGKTGSVYLTIPEKGSGQVSVVVQGGLKQFDAVSSKKIAIATGEKVRIVSVNGNILSVEQID